MHFRAARRPFISWGDSSSTHACAVAMRAFFLFWEKLVTFVLFSRWWYSQWPSSDMKKKKYFFYDILYISILSFIQFIKKIFFPHITNKKVQSVTWNCFQTSQTKDFSSCYKYYQTVSTFNVWTEKKKLASIILNWKV